MTTFEDGPAKGKSLLIRRAPTYLRVVVSDAGEVDALDQLDDSPKVNEKVFAYKLVKNNGSVHLCGTSNGRRWGGTYHMATYRLCEQQPDIKILRWTTHWQAWCQEQLAAESSSKGKQ